LPKTRFQGTTGQLSDKPTTRQVPISELPTTRKLSGYPLVNTLSSSQLYMIGDGVGGMHIGLIGGIGPGATDFYYRRLISTFARKNATLELTIVHADTPTLLSNLTKNDAAAQTAIYTRLTNRLVSAAAACVGVTSIAGHFCIDDFKAVSPLPVVDLIAEVSRAVETRGLKRIGIIGTRTVMETRFYGRITSAEIVPPRKPDLDDVHQAYISMAASGFVTEDQRSIFNAVCHRLVEDQGAEAIMLGGTDLALAFNEQTAEFPLVDCAGIHADAIAKLAIV
jgi:aspartate racemase